MITDMADYISNMPDNVTTNIMNRLPLKDAVRTGSLARSWRFKWTLLTDVIVDEDLFYYLTNTFDGRHITRLLLQLIGPVRRFVFSVEPKTLFGQDDLNYEDIHEWLLFLARVGVEEVTIRNWYADPVTLPTQLYYRQELTFLKLHCCTFPTMTSFRGFPKLLSLELCNVNFHSGTVWDLVAGCPLLESLKLDRCSTNEMRLWDIAILRNLKTLNLSFGIWNHPMTITTSNIFQLSNVPKLETLTMDFQDCNVRPISFFHFNLHNVKVISNIDAMLALKLKKIRPFVVVGRRYLLDECPCGLSIPQVS